MADKSDKTRDPFGKNEHATRDAARLDTLSRRNVLFAGSSVAALSTLGVASSPGKVQAQQQPSAASGRKPNILVIFGVVDMHIDEVC